MPHHLRVRLFPKMKMWRKNVLEQMHQEVADQHKQERALAANPHRFWNHVGERHGQHITRAQGHEVLQELPRPILPNHEQAAKQIPRRGHDSKPRRHRHPHSKFVCHLERGGLAAAFLECRSLAAAFQMQYLPTTEPASPPCLHFPLSTTRCRLSLSCW